jgi:hypothetical protein
LVHRQKYGIEAGVGMHAPRPLSIVRGVALLARLGVLQLLQAQAAQAILRRAAGLRRIAGCRAAPTDRNAPREDSDSYSKRVHQVPLPFCQTRFTRP